jgi:hypothetical protein
MPSTYTTNLGIEKIATGEQSGTWGTTTNTNFDLIDTAVNGIVSITLASAGTSGSPNDLPITDGTASNGRNKFIEFVDGGDLGATAYVQLTPNDAEKIVHIRNSLSGSRSIIVFQGTYNASNDFEIPNGADVTLKFDGAGTGATVTDVNVDLTVTGVTATSTASFSGATIDDLGTVTTADINGGTIDGTVIGGSSAAAGTFTTFTSTGIDDNATSTAITIDSSQRVGIGTSSPFGELSIKSASPQVYLETVANGNVQINFNETADQLDVMVNNSNGKIAFGTNSAERMRIDSSGNVGIGTTSPSSDSIVKFLHINDATSSGLVLQGAKKFSVYSSSSSSLIFRDETAGTNRITLDSSGNVGIGTTSPATFNAAQCNNLVVGTGSGAEGITVYSGTTSQGGLAFADGTSASDQYRGLIQYDHNSNNMLFWTNTSERMRIDSSGNVGIGTSNPSFILGTGLHIDSTGYTSIVLQKGGAGQGHNIDFTDESNTLQYRIGTNFASGGQNLLFAYGSTPTIGMTLNSSGNVGIGTTSPSGSLHVSGTNTTIRITDTASTADYSFQATANDIRLYDNTAAAERMRIDSSGNVGIGTASPNSYANYTTLTLRGTTGSEVDFENSSGTVVGAIYNTATNLTIASDFTNAVADSNIVFTCDGSERMRIDSSGRTLIGTTVADQDAKLTVVGSGAGGSSPATISANTVATFRRTGGLSHSANVSILGGSTGFSVLNLGDRDDEDVGRVYYDHTNNAMLFDTNAAERMRIDSSGNLLVGTTSLGSASGINVYGANATQGIEISNTASLADNRQAAVFVGYNTAVSNIGCYKHSGVTYPSGYAYFSDSGNNKYFIYHNSGVWRTSTSSNDIGTTSGTVIGTQTSDERLKNIEPTFEYGIDHVMQLNPIAYTRNDEEAPVRRLGFGAQTTQAVVPEAVYNTGECLDGYDQDSDDVMVQTARSSETKLAMEYVQLIPVLTKAIQEQQAMIEELKAEVAALKGA